MLEQDKFIELLSREERSGECWSIKLNGTPIWPLIRFSAYFAWRNKKGSYGEVKDVSLKINADNLAKARIEQKESSQRKRILLISRDEGLNDRVDGKLFDKFISSIRILLEPVHDISLVAIGPRVDRFDATVYLTSLLQSVSKNMAVNVPNSEVKILDAFLRRFGAQTGLDISLQTILNAYGQFLLGRTFWTKVISTYKPDYVISTCFYIPLFAGACAAARNCGVCFVDLQHGRVGEAHPVMSNWDFSEADPNALSLFPTEFWCWQDENKDRIKQTWKGMTDLPKAKTFGNPWQYLRTNNVVELSSNTETHVQEPKLFTILIALQPIDNSLPQFFVNALNCLDKKRVWIRPHPHQMGEISQIEMHLSDLGLADFVIRSDQDLYSEFGKIDVLVTAFSTVGSEAAIFGVPVILVHPNATVAFDGLIDGQNVMYCNSADDSIAALQSLSARVIKVERSQSCGFSSFNTDCIV